MRKKGANYFAANQNTIFSMINILENLNRSKRISLLRVIIIFFKKEVDILIYK